MNAVLLLDLDQAEVKALSLTIEKGLSSEYSGGRWHHQEDLADPAHAPAIRQFARDLHAHDILMGALHEEALAVDAARRDDR